MLHTSFFFIATINWGHKYKYVTLTPWKILVARGSTVVRLMDQLDNVSTVEPDTFETSVD